jgi:hypothetical protein
MTMPGPRLILDVEGRMKYTPTEKIVWDPRHEPPTGLTENSTVLVKVKDFNTFDLVTQWLQSGRHPFHSFGIDSVTEVQKRAMDQIAGINQPDQQDWGALLRRTERLARDARDLTDHPVNPLWVVVMVATTQLDKGNKQRPRLQGQIAETMPSYVDLNGYYFSEFDPETQAMVRKLIIQPMTIPPNVQVVAKDGTDLLTQWYGPIIRTPNFTEMLAVLNQPTPEAPPA